MKSDDDSDPAHYSWDQDETTVLIKIPLPEHNEDISVDVTEKSCSVSSKGKELCSVKLFKDIDPTTKKIDIRQNEVFIHVKKKVENAEWTSLELEEAGVMEDEESFNLSSNQEDEKSGCLKTCNINHIKNDMFEMEAGTLNLTLYVKQIVKDSVRVDIEPEALTVTFRTNDENFLRLNPNTDSETVFVWSAQLKHPVVPKKCKFTIKSVTIVFILHKEKLNKWGTLTKPQNKKAASSTPSGDWVPLKHADSQNKGKGPASRDKNSMQGPNENHGAKGGAKSLNMGENRSQKPTCAVPPLAHRQQGSAKDSSVQPIHPLGFTGLDNLGNTCFMNGVLQVLANTRELKDFMLEDNVTQEINFDNPLGTGGQLVTSFAVLMKLLWSGKYKSYAPSKFKTIIASKASQFMGFAQHDAQEFMDFLLDGLHEDLNRVKNKPYTPTVDSDGRPDEMIAEDSWKSHRRRNDSFVADIFQGQYKSKLVCPVCKKVSITFDPFMQLSVPLPRKKQQLPVYFWSKEVYRKPIRMKLLVTTDGNVLELKQAVAERTGVEMENLRVFEVFKGRVHKYFKDKEPLSGVALNDIIFVCEVLSTKLAGEDVYECVVFQRKFYPSAAQHCSNCRTESRESNNLKRCTRCLKVAYCNQDCQKQHWSSHKSNCKQALEIVGMPFMISLPASHATYARLSQTMESIARYSTNMFQPPVSSSSSSTSSVKRTPPPGMGMGEEGDDEVDYRVDDDDDDQSMEDVDAELAAEMIVKDSPQPSSDEEGDVPRGAVGGESRSKKKDEPYKKTADGVATASVIGQPQVPEGRQPLFFIKPCSKEGIGLRGAIGERLKDEGDSPLDMSRYHALAMDWRNDPKQLNHVLVESKPLDFDEEPSGSRTASEKVTTLEQCLQLFTESEKLTPEEAWYCPRCKEHREASKELSLWRLPAMLIIQLKRFSFKNFIWRDKIDKMVEFPLRGLDLSDFSQVKGHLPVYDLYGVINHHGGILGGHYTAYARLISKDNYNHNELDWRLFDDSHVTRTTEDNVVTRSAYLLFYRLRKSYVTYVPPPLPPAEPAVKEDTAQRSAGKTSSADDVSASSVNSRLPESSKVKTKKDNRCQETGGHISGEEECGMKKQEVKYTNIDEID